MEELATLMKGVIKEDVRGMTKVELDVVNYCKEVMSGVTGCFAKEVGENLFA